jgi:hypothetical protein
VVDIEERLLRFPPEAALRAWRLFRVRTDEKRLVLDNAQAGTLHTGESPRA